MAKYTVNVITCNNVNDGTWLDALNGSQFIVCFELELETKTVICIDARFCERDFT